MALLPTARAPSVPDSSPGPLPRPGQGCMLGVQHPGVRAVPLLEVLPPACRFGRVGHRTLTSPSPRSNSPRGGALIPPSQPGHQPPHSQPQSRCPVLQVNTLLGRSASNAHSSGGRGSRDSIQAHHRGTVPVSALSLHGLGQVIIQPLCALVSVKWVY